MAEAVDRPYSAKEQLELLQSACSHLNDPIIEADAKALKEMVAAGQKVEPLTGEQIRRRIINGVGRSAEILEPEYTPEWILSETDKIMDARATRCKSDAVASRVPSPSEILDARLGWWETEASRRAHAYDEQREDHLRGDGPLQAARHPAPDPRRHPDRFPVCLEGSGGRGGRGDPRVRHHPR